ncbi:MAG: DUF5305 domain-containing protein [Clostridiales bacterium]|nr:DUF5305 domain-containing protein [Clostridiales bacterium]
MRLKINKKIKVVLIVLMVIAIGICSSQIYRELKIPKFAERKDPVYTYDNKSFMNYEVFLKPNRLYDKASQGEGEVYITEYVDFIKAKLNHEYKGDKSAAISGDYSIAIRAKGFISERDKITDVWEKSFPIIEHEKFEAHGDVFNINKEIDIELDEYNEFVREIIETSKIKCETALDIIMDVNLKANVAEGEVEETISSDLVIPLNVLMFNIGGNNEVKKSGSIERTEEIQLPPDKNKNIKYGVTAGILLLGLIYLIFFTVPAVAKDPLKKELDRIFRKYGERLVALDNDFEHTGDNVKMVKAMEDLIRIADELEKPVFYKYSDDYKEIGKFYVINQSDTYAWDIQKGKGEQDKETEEILGETASNEQSEMEGL